MLIKSLFHRRIQCLEQAPFNRRTYCTPPFFAFPKKRNQPASTHRRHCNPIFSLCGLAGSFAPCFQSLPIGLALSSLLYNSRVSDVVTAQLHPAQVDVPTTAHSSQHMWSQVQSASSFSFSSSLPSFRRRRITGWLHQPRRFGPR